MRVYVLVAALIIADAIQPAGSKNDALGMIVYLTLLGAFVLDIWELYKGSNK